MSSTAIFMPAPDQADCSTRVAPRPQAAWLSAETAATRPVGAVAGGRAKRRACSASRLKPSRAQEA